MPLRNFIVITMAGNELLILVSRDAMIMVECWLTRTKGDDLIIYTQKRDMLVMPQQTFFYYGLFTHCEVGEDFAFSLGSLDQRCGKDAC